MKRSHSETAPKAAWQDKVSVNISDILFSPFRKILLVVDFMVMSTAFLGFAWISPYSQIVGIPKEFFYLSALYAAVCCAVLLGLGYYDRLKRFNIASILVKGSIACVLASAFVISATYLLYYIKIGRLTFIWGAGGALLCSLSLRLVMAWLYRSRPYRFTALGNSSCVEEIRNYCTNDKYAKRYYVYVDVSRRQQFLNENLVDHLICEKVSDVVISPESLDQEEMVQFSLLAVSKGLRLVNELDFYWGLFEKFPVDYISKSWVMGKCINANQKATSIAKRIFDILASGAALVALTPVLLFLMLAIRFSSPGPIFFNQPRLGRYCRPFTMYKFRSMREEDSSLAAEGGFTQKNDPRVTWVGRFMRPLHLDELPQLLNIFLGQMSIVGPRPEALSFAQRMREEIPLYEFRYIAKPGLTGKAQISQGYAIDTVDATKEKLSYDLFYLCNYSLTLDLRIIIATVFALIRNAR